ncbi:glycosyltransferase [Mucilaginibacter myungsuensis]|uniref:Glycosyltransferase n=1 Tax=Mucilaginibacter myungsuensis TaxID=649104 RepID=A0A929KXN7_9SPHI|nr:glycosyltransferase [Mucilaginibacter myungsuensis]MBE9662410.1 glycosyltransferase [Mucilaginibacter myungsuensis]MDN3599153.1 glycosyltransferase [Mucilaginibacter myungsuensis]
MKVLLVSAFPPSKHNINGPSALPYYLAAQRHPEIDIDLINFVQPNANELVTADLKKVFANIINVPKTPKHIYYPVRALQKTGIVKATSGIYFDYLPNRKVLKQINESNYDLIWIYPHTLYPWYKRLSHLNVVMTGPDCSLLHLKLVKKIFSKSKSNKFSINIDKRISEANFYEKRWSLSKALIHTVGKDDLDQYIELGAANHSFFSNHPYSSYKPSLEPIVNASGKLKIVVSGVNNSVYIGDLWNRIVDKLVENRELNHHYEFIFIGKDFEDGEQKLIAAGYNTSLSTWVESYEDRIAQAHIQLFPIILGTGTKGKVLSALATGLLCIGTAFALENILIDPNDDAILFGSEQEAINALYDIAGHKSKYNAMAHAASVKVRDMHSSQNTAKEFWDYITKFFNIG